MLDYAIKVLAKKLDEINYTLLVIPDEIPQTDKDIIDNKKEQLERAINALTDHDSITLLVDKTTKKHLYDHR